MGSPFNINPNLGFNNILQQEYQAAQPRQPGAFRRILGAAVGMAGNMFAPGVGGAIGSLIGGGLGRSSGGSNLFAQGEAQLAQNEQQEESLLEIQRQNDAQTERIQMASGVLQAKHQTVMAIINSLKS